MQDLFSYYQQPLIFNTNSFITPEFHPLMKRCCLWFIYSILSYLHHYADFYQSPKKRFK